MKKTLLFLSFFTLNTDLLVAQTVEHPHALTLSYIANDFQAPITNAGWLDFTDKHKTSGVDLAYSLYISKGFNLRVPISYNNVRYPIGVIEKGVPKEGWKSTEALSVDLQLLYKLNDGRFYPVNKTVEPFVYVGVAAAGVMYDLKLQSSNSIFYSPWGLGLKVHLSPNFSWVGEAGYRLNLTGTPQNNFLLKTGISYMFGQSEQMPVTTEITQANTAKKNTADSTATKDKEVAAAEDAKKLKMEEKPGISLNSETTTELSASVASKAALSKRLPDTAKIVKVFAGTIKDETQPANPIEPDKDGDGTPDSRDKCPSFKGAPEDEGCPRGLYDDSDGDGVADEVDKCPKKKGSFFNFGCPQREEVTFTENGIQFLPGQKVIESISLPILDKIIVLLKENPAHKIYIVGHTDNIGESITNMELSKQRAIACAEYLISKKIEENRISTDGFGETKPIDTNTTEAGRARNRRVEFTFYTGNKKK